MSTLAALRQALGTAVDSLPELAGTKEFSTKEREIEEIERKIVDLEKAQARQAKLARPAGHGGNDDGGGEVETTFQSWGEIRAQNPIRGKLGFDDYTSMARKAFNFAPRRDTHFRSLGEQLQSVFTHAMSRGAEHDSRLVRAPTGGSEVDPTGGGFLVQIDFASAIFMLAHDMGRLLSEVNKITISANANGIKIPGVDETSRANGSRWGGVSTTWVGEGTAVTPSRPKFRLIEFDLKKMMSTAYMTDELLQDTTALTGIYSQAFAEEIVFTTESAIFSGTGAGMPLGVMSSGAKIAVPKDAADTTATLSAKDVINMWARLWARSMSNAKWYVQQDCLPSLITMNVPVSTAGGQIVYMPPGGLSATPYATLLGREVVFTEYAPALGTEGDILLADLSQYTLVDKNGVSAATSMHVAFLTDEMVFRITYRVDGRPMWTVPLTPFAGLTKSPFITCATRP